jgi:hypothetical protein
MKGGTPHLQNKKVILAHISNNEGADFYPEGKQGLIDIAINHAIADPVSQKIQHIKSSPFVEKLYYLPFEKSLCQKSVKIQKIGLPFKTDKLEKFFLDEKKYAHYDFKFLKTQYHADYAFILNLHRFGVKRSYYAFVPISRPVGWVSGDLSLINLNDNTLAGYYKVDVSVPVPGEWDNPPQYPELTQSVKEALLKGLNNSYSHFFD